MKNDHTTEAHRELRKPKVNVQTKETEAETLYKQGAWSMEEKELYRVFVSDNSQMFAKGKTRTFQAFKEMSYSISTRSPLQCRIHHRRVLSSARMKEAKRRIRQYTPQKGPSLKVEDASSDTPVSQPAAKKEQPQNETGHVTLPQQSVLGSIGISTSSYSNPPDYEILQRYYEVQQQAWMLWMASQGYRY